MSDDVPEGLWTDTRTESQTRAMYDAWAAAYDADMEAGGMIGPARVAEMLTRVVDDRAAPILDFGCGTGLCGVALSKAGFTTFDGVDLSAEMLRRAGALDLYRDLRLVEPDRPARVPEGIRAVTASGSICVGAGPARLLRELCESLAPGGVLVTTHNQDTLRDPDYMRLLADLQTEGVVRLEVAEHGPQLPALNRTATVYALRRL